jgi:hypothetical protein
MVAWCDGAKVDDAPPASTHCGCRHCATVVLFCARLPAVDLTTATAVLVLVLIVVAAAATGDRLAGMFAALSSGAGSTYS